MSNFDYQTAGLNSPPIYPESQEPVLVNELNSPTFLIVLIAFFLLAKCLVPASKGIYVSLPYGLYIWWAEIGLIIFVLLVSFSKMFGIITFRTLKATRRNVLLPIFLLGILQVISITWNGQDNLHKGYSFIQSFMMCVSVFAAVIVVSGMHYASRMRVTSGLVVIIVAVVLVYMGLSFVFPSWRPSFAWKDRTDLGLGFIRVFGPLAPASTLSFVLLPALGYAISRFAVLGRQRLIWSLIALLILAGILGTGSRAAVLGLGAFVFLFMLVYRISSLKVILPIGVLLGMVLLFTGIPERYISFEDKARVETYKTGMRAFSSSPKSVIVGVGHGGFYSRLFVLTQRYLKGKDRWYLISKRTKYGSTIYSAHSTIVRLLVETGITGLVLFMVMPIWFIRRLFAPRYARIRDPLMLQWRIAMAGCVASLVLIPFDVYIISYSWLTFIWLLLAIASAETIGEVHLERVGMFGEGQHEHLKNIK